MSVLHQWAVEWRVPLEALQDLQKRLGMLGLPAGAAVAGPSLSEAWVQSTVRLEAAQKGFPLFRNNVGVLLDKTGRPVRYGLANDSAKLNGIIKSADLIGVRPVVIRANMIGHTFGQFISRECKPPGWAYGGNEHEAAQLAWANLINSRGGDARFATGTGTL